MSYDARVVLARVVAVLILALTLIQAGNAELLGVTPRIGAWLAIIVGVLGGVAGYLPDFRGTAADPAHIANRIMELTPAERLDLQADVEQRHRVDATVPNGGYKP